MATIKPTFKEPISPHSEKFEKDFDKGMVRSGAPTLPKSNVNLTEMNSMLSEVEQSLKKKIWSLGKMEALVFSDPKLSAVYEEMAENGEEKYGYHYNETIMNMLFNDYVLNSPKYLQKYKMAIPKEKKRRDKSGINQLKKAGEKKMDATGTKLKKPKQPQEVVEGTEPVTKVMFLVNERDPEDPDLFAYFPEEIHNGEYRTAYSHIGQHSSAHPDYAKESREASPEEYANLKAELEGIGYDLEILNGLQESTTAGSAGGAAGYVGYAGPAAFSSKGDLSGDFKGKKKKKRVDPKAKPISTGFALHETDYLTDSSGWAKYVETLNEESDAAFIGKHGSNTYGSVDNMNSQNQKIIKKDIQSGKMDSNHNIKGGIALQEKAKSVAQQQLMGMAYAYKKGELDTEPSDEIKKIAAGMSEKDLDDFASTKHKGLPDHVDETMGQPDIDYLVKAFEIINAGPHYDPAKAEAFRANLSQMDDAQAQQISRKFEAMLRQMGYTNPQQVMNQQVQPMNEAIMTKSQLAEIARNIEEGYSIVNPEPMKQIGWISLPNYKYGGASIFNVPENDDFGKRSNADYIMASPYENEYRVVDDGNNQYHIEQNPRFWQRYINVDPETRRVVFMDDNEKFKYLGKYTDIQIDPNKRWSRDADTEKFWSEIKKLQRDGASFEFNGQPIFDDENNIKEDMQTMIQNNGTSMSNKSQATGDMSSEVPMGAQQTSGLNESDMKIFEEINKELEAFSIHHDKLKLMAEDKKTPSMVQGDRLRAENPKNFKKDMAHSGTKDIIDVEKELQWKDQQTDVGDDPMKLGQDIEKTEIKSADMKSGEALKNVGDSTNRPGDEVPKRNLTTKEQEEVDLYRNGQHSLNYDNEPSERFVDRMEADQGEFFEMGEKQKEFKKDAPMYDKDSQPIDDGIEKVQFDKNNKKKGDKVAWNERMGIESNMKLGESMITGRYIDELGKRRLMEFRLGEVEEVEAIAEHEAKMSFDGLGNTYMSKTVDKKVVVNEGVVDIMENYQFYTNGEKVFSIKNPVKQLNENEVKEKPVVNEQMDKMKHLLGYKPEAYVSTKGVKQNRKF